MEKEMIVFESIEQFQDAYQKIKKNGIMSRKKIETLFGFKSIMDKLEEYSNSVIDKKDNSIGKEKLYKLLNGKNGLRTMSILRYDPILSAMMNENGTIKIKSIEYSIINNNELNNITKVLPQYEELIQADENGYKYTEEPSEDLVKFFPVNNLFPFTFPGYPTKVFYDKFDGREVIIQVWKGIAGFSSSRKVPGGVGGEVGIYHGHKPTFAELLIAAIIKAFWPPYYEEKWNLEYTLYNEKGEIFISAAHDGIWWLHRWMKNDSYNEYKKTNNLTKSPDRYYMEFKVQGKKYSW